MPRFTRLEAERQESGNGKEWNKEPDINKYVDMLVQAGFEVALSHVFHQPRNSLRYELTGRRLLVDREMLNPYRAKRLAEEASVKTSQ